MNISQLKFYTQWKRQINDLIEDLGLGSQIDPNNYTLVVNQFDLTEYENYLSTIYEGGIVPTYGGVLRFKMFPLGIGPHMDRNECALVRVK